MITENEGDFYVELEHCKKRALAIVNLYVKDEMISHIAGDILLVSPNEQLCAKLKQKSFQAKKLSLSILLGTNFTDNHLEDCRFVSLGFLNN
jgi:hypothetical protein